MLFGFRADKTDLLYKFLKDFQDPPGVVSRTSSLWCYGYIRVYEVDDVFIIKTNGLLEFLGLRASIIMLMAYIVLMVLNNTVFTFVLLPFMFLCLFFYFTPYHAFLTVNKLKRYGYKGNVKILDYFSVRARYDYVSGSCVEDS